MQVSLCRLRTHRWIFVLCNVLLFHALLFGADFVEELFLRSPPLSSSGGRYAELGERAQSLDMSPLKENISGRYVVSGSEVCAGEGVFLLLVIFSRPEERRRRERIRGTWASVRSVRGHNVTRVFLMGSSDSPAVQSEVFNESQAHRDIVQGGRVQSPVRSAQAAMMLEWTVTFCPGAAFLLKADQQTFVNVRSVATYLLSLKPGVADLYLGRVMQRGPPDRDPGSPGFVPLSAYSAPFYPDYCSGSALALSRGVVRKMYLLSAELRPSLPDDVYLGICAQRAGVTPTHSARFSGANRVPYNRCCYQAIFSSAGMEDSDLSAIWRDLGGGATCSKLETYYGLVSCKIWTYLDRLRYLATRRTAGSGRPF